MDSPSRSRIDGRELGAKEGRAPGRQVSHDCFPDSRIGTGTARQAADEVAKVETRSSRNYGKPAAAADLVAGRIRETHEVAYGVLLADIADIYESMRNATSEGRIGLGRPNVQPPISLHRIRADDLGLGQVVCLSARFGTEGRIEEGRLSRSRGADEEDDRANREGGIEPAYRRLGVSPGKPPCRCSSPPPGS